MQAFAIAGATHMGGFSFNTSQLDRIVSRIRSGWRSFMDTLNQQGQP
ncbi:protease FtsH-inhibitory lysogeny factor CIII [Pantoea sp. Al-1710]|uniref:Protease FtsH-inhibitory lysogeny factor CIII n=1 Tax=Candidatus Pantoea communis TaxID=2608354 RepID=A0ABX0RIK2_9GAMM|nr:protease FtsH-inhibitory lysogeny factor CIII [Pantoea communis]